MKIFSRIVQIAMVAAIGLALVVLNITPGPIYYEVASHPPGQLIEMYEYGWPRIAAEVSVFRRSTKVTWNASGIGINAFVFIAVLGVLRLLSEFLLRRWSAIFEGDRTLTSQQPPQRKIEGESAGD
jgi:hypothetical protein